MNYTNQIETVLFSKTTGVCGGRECIAGTRLERTFIRRLRNNKGLNYVLEAYPHITRAQVEAC